MSNVKDQLLEQSSMREARGEAIAMIKDADMLLVYSERHGRYPLGMFFNSGFLSLSEAQELLERVKSLLMSYVVDAPEAAEAKKRKYDA